MSMYPCHVALIVFVSRLAPAAMICPASNGSFAGSPTQTTILISLSVTPWAVAPPFLPVNGWTHGGAYTVGIFTRPVVVSQLGPKSTFDLPSNWAFSGVIGPALTSAAFLCASAVSSSGAALAVAASEPPTSVATAITVATERRAALPVQLLFPAMWSSPLNGLPVAACRSAGGATREQLGHVAVVKARLGVASGGPQRFLELGERVLAALGVRVVRREHEQLRPGLLDHPAHRLTRERRELEMPADVLGGRELERAQRLLGPLECALAVVELAQPGHDPRRALLDASASELREAIEQPVVDEDAQEQRRRVRDGEEVLRADVLAATEVIRHRHVVVVERRIQETAAAADVEHEGDVRLAQRVPEAVEVGVRGRAFAGGGRGDHHRRAAVVDRLRRQRHGARRLDQGHERDRVQPCITRAELDHGAVLRRAPRVQAVDIAPGEHRRGERREHQLTLEAEQVERTGPLDGIERPQRQPPLLLEQPLLRLGGGRRVRPAGGGARHRGLEQRRERVHGASPEPVALVRIDVLVEEVRQLHDVTVGVEDLAVAGVRHGSPQRRVRAAGD